MLKKQGVRTAYIWMMLVSISLILWLLLLVFPKDRFSPLIISNWFRFGDTVISLRFALTSRNWILAISLLAFNLAFFLTGIARLNVRTDLKYWIIQLVLIALSFLAVLSADLWSVVLFWTALDLLDLVFHRIISKEIGGNTYFQKITFKFLGSMLLIWNIAALSGSGFNPLIDGLVASTSNTSLFLAAFLHSGIFPLKTEPGKNSEGESGKLLKSAFSVINFVVSFSLIISLPAPELPLLLSFFISLISYFIIISSMIHWVLNKDLEVSLKFLLIGEAGVFIFLYFSGATQYITYRLALITLSVLWLVLFTRRGKNLAVFPVINIFFASGLPISLIAFGPRGFIGSEFSLGLVVLIVMQVLFFLGYLKHVFEKNEEFNDLEVWYQAAYLAGLFLPLLSIAAIIFNSMSSLANEIQYWWVGAIVATLASIGFFYTKRKKFFNKSPQYTSEAKMVWLWKFLTFEWFFKIISFIKDMIGNFINGFSGLLEGEGGILWALVLLLLILTVLR